MPEIDGSTESKEGPKVEQVGTPLRLKRAMSTRMVLDISGLVSAFIDPRLNCDGGQTCVHDCAALSNIQPRELIGTQARQALAPLQHMRRWPLVAPSQVEFMFESKQFSVSEVEKEGVAELAGSAKNVWQVGWTWLSPISTAAHTALTLDGKF